MRKIGTIIFMALTITVTAQQNDDSIRATKPFEVVVRAYEQNRPLLDVSAAVGRLGSNDLNRFNNTSFVQALNTLPGVKMEERSPGSYRVNIRGSSLRSPFGVRNVKVYYNGIPFTDPGGNTYLNQLGFYNVSSIEVIRGPGSSLYGAGTGGVMLLESKTGEAANGITLDHSVGSYNLQNTNVNVGFGNEQYSSSVNYQHQTSNGYRAQSELERNILAYNAVLQLNKNQLTAHFLYSDLYYQTPGALTQAEYNTNPRAARPRAGAAPGAAEARAAIYLKTFMAGTSYKQVFNDQWQHTTTLYGAFAELKNPAIRNYGRNVEPHYGGRTLLQFTNGEGRRSSINWHIGAELQKGINTVQVFNNRAGKPDSLLTNDEINNSQFFVFTQASWQIGSWIFTGGLSLNETKLNLARTTNRPSTNYSRKFNNELAPRLAILNKLSENISLFGSFSRGFSPPTIGELSPSGSAINIGLNAETGNSFEAGIRGNTLKGRLAWEATAFHFNLQNTIVQRRDAFGGDYFINAGSTRQRGIESNVSYRLAGVGNRLLTPLSRMWVTHNWYRFLYKDFTRLENNFSGKSLPGISPHTVTAGLDLYTRAGIYLNFTYTYADAVPLNDANTAFAGAYNLAGGRLGYKATLKQFSIEVFTGVDNFFDVRYSLGNDLNAFGGRYFNAAAGRNYYTGLSIRRPWKVQRQAIAKI